MTPAEIFRLTRELVGVDSVTGREAAIGELLERRLRSLAARAGGVVERMPVPPGDAGRRFTLLAAGGEPVVVPSTHLDPVPPFLPPSEDAEHIHGRGACDAKGAIAAMLAAAERLLEDGVRGFGVLLVAGEETDSAGAEAANRRPPRGVRYLIDGEPTENRPAAPSQGALYLRTEPPGPPPPPPHPDLADSPLDPLL